MLMENKHLELEKERRRRYWVKNRRKICARRKLNRKKLSEIERRSRNKNIERVRKYQREYQSTHREKIREYSRNSYRNMRRIDPLGYRDRVAVNVYGLAPGQFLGMFAEQEGRCAICHAFFGLELQVDHDHNTKAIRGLLCHKCNKGLGIFGESVELLSKALEYVKMHKEA